MMVVYSDQGERQYKLAVSAIVSIQVAQWPRTSIKKERTARKARTVCRMNE